MPLCAACQKFDLRTTLLSSYVIPECNRDYITIGQSQDVYYRHSDNLVHLRDAASNGCGLCNLIYTAFERKGPEAAQLAVKLPVVITGATTVLEGADNGAAVQQRRLEPQIAVYLVDPEDGPLEICKIDLSAQDGITFETGDLLFRPHRKLSTNPSDARCMAMASEWLWKCVDSHDCSASGTIRTKLLTRFIDIGNCGGLPRLVERKPEDLPRHWISLSYRWGREPSQKLTKSSIDRLKQGIDLQELDATIRDAIVIAKGLEIQHLWIDALCILQDDESDWSKQSSQMTEIYGRSTVTLVPVSSPCVSQGFLMSRNQRYLAVPWRMPEYHGKNNQNSVLRQVYLSEFRSHEDRLEGPWSERGWTLQEGLLPQRVLFYTSKQMVWKCGRETLYERGIRKEPLLEVVRGIMDEPGGRPFRDLDLFTKWKLLRWFVQGPECRKSDDKYLIWHSLIEDYSTRQFSRPQDRLVAVSGLAQSYGDVIGDDEYCAGLWKQDMIRGLLWRTPGAMLFDASITHRKVVGNVVCPSWSWVEAASTYRIRNDWAHVTDFQKKATIENVNSSLVETSNPFGNVTCASISISGPILQFTKLYHDDWQSQSAQLTAFERHISRIIERDYSERAQEFSHQGHYAALRMLQEFPSIDHRIDVLLLQSVAPLVDTGVMEARRLGVITLSYISENLTSSSTLRSVKRHENSAYRRLNPERRPRRSKRLHCKEVFQEYAQKPWSHQTVRIV